MMAARFAVPVSRVLFLFFTGRGGSFLSRKEKEKNGGAKKGGQCPPLRILSQKEHPNAEHSLSFSCDYMQTNATVIDAMLKSYQGVIAASTGHISVHEAGAIDFGGHKVLTLPHHNGKISASQIKALLEQYQNDANHDHMVMPGMVYLSHPTEYGTLYSREELIEIRSSVSSRTPRWSGWQSRWNSASGKRMMIPIRSSAFPQAGQTGRRTRRHCRTSERSK